jgi:hypothetical protein
MKTITRILLLSLLALSASAQPYSLLFPEPINDAFHKIDSNMVWTAAQLAGQADADTNAIVKSPHYVYWSTNSIATTYDVRYTLPITVTNPESVTFDLAAGNSQLWWAPAGTTNWAIGQVTTNVPVIFSFRNSQMPAAFAVPIDPIITNVVIYALARPDLFGRTNQMFGQSVRVKSPTDPSDAASKRYVDTAVAAVNYIQQGGIYLQGAALNMDASWTTSAGSNGIVWKYLGVDSLRIANPVLNFATVTSISVTNGVVWLRIWTNGVTATPVPHWSRTLEGLAWQVVAGVTNGYPTVSGTNYVISFPTPDPTQAFIRVALAATQPNFAELSAILTTPPRTITNGNSTTWGNGYGMVTWDTNYLYISVGTNAWKRAAISTW